MNAIEFKPQSHGCYEVKLSLLELYKDNSSSLSKFNKKWFEFLDSDKNLQKLLKRKNDLITYPHKSWIPQKINNKPSVLFLFGNPAPHSVIDDIYFSYEGDGREHRFWRVLRELDYIKIGSNPSSMKNRFFNLEYESLFRLGFEVIYTFPSAASNTKWSGVAGLEKLFGKSALSKLFRLEKKRLYSEISNFFMSSKNGHILAFQKDAYNAVSINKYNLNEALLGTLSSNFHGISILGVPPTRWLYTQKMQRVLSNARNEIIFSDFPDNLAKDKA